MSLFESGFNLPPGCSLGDPRAPWNQDFPPGVEDVLDTVIMWPEGPDEDTLVPEFGKVTDWQEGESDVEADELGHPVQTWSGPRVEITLLFHGQPPRTAWIDIDDLNELIVPDELKPIVDAYEEAERLERLAQGQRNMVANRRADAGRKAVRARWEQ